MINFLEIYKWFFSAMAQSLAALFALGGVFAVFRLQLLEAELEKFIIYIRRSTNTQDNYVAAKELKRLITQSSQRKKDNTPLRITIESTLHHCNINKRQVKSILDKWNALESHMVKMKRKAVETMTIIGIVFFWSIINLFLYPYYCLNVNNRIIIGANILLFIILTISLAQLITLSLKTTPEYIKDYKNKLQLGQ